MLRFLDYDWRVAWVERFNVGAHVIDEALQAKVTLLTRRRVLE